MLYAFMETKGMKVNGYEIAYSIFSVPKSPNTGFISCFLVRLCPGGGGGIRYILVWEVVARPSYPDPV